MQKSSFQDAFKSIMGTGNRDKVQKKMSDAGDDSSQSDGAANSKAPAIAKKFKEDNRSEEAKEETGKSRQVASNGPILSKYKKPAALAQAERTKEEEERERKLLKERQRAQGRKIPDVADEEHERNLVRLATKGVVELFNTVREFQSNTLKEARQE